MKYKCSKCGFNHEGEMCDGYYCPLCGSSKFDFELIEKEKKEYKRVYICENNPAIYRIDEKCINCGACSHTCEKIVNIKYLDPNDPICIKCGQCILTCPTGSLVPKYDYNKVLNIINEPNKTVVAITSPAVRVAIGDAFSKEPGLFLEGKMIGALKALGFDYVFDTSFGADLTVMEEASEALDRLKNDKVLPMFTGCCPSWVEYAKIYHPNLIPNISTCKTPIAMLSSVIKKIIAVEEKIDVNNLIVVALTPCTAKKSEIINTDCDYVITTSELSLAIRENNLIFADITDAKFDELIGSTSGTLFGTTGGVMKSMLRTMYYFETGKDMPEDLLLIKDKNFYQEYSIKINKKIIKTAVVHKMGNLEKILPFKEEFVLIEVMNCNMGCIGGGGQVVTPIVQAKNILNSRAENLTKNDKKGKLKYPYKNEEIIEIYEDYFITPLSKKSYEILHTSHENKSS